MQVGDRVMVDLSGGNKTVGLWCDGKRGYIIEKDERGYDGYDWILRLDRHETIVSFAETELIPIDVTVVDGKAYVTRDSGVFINRSHLNAQFMDGEEYRVTIERIRKED